MPIPAFIVEGRAEQKIVQRLCPAAKVMILECNGDHVELSAIAKKVAALARLCGNRHYPIIVQFDREKRNLTTGEIEQQLANHLEVIGLDIGQFRFGVADRDMESWILYAVDEEGNFDADCSGSTIDQYEGFAGEYTLRKRLLSKGLEYHKTTSGVDLFTRLSASSLSQKSISFRNFATSVHVACYWLEQ